MRLMAVLGLVWALGLAAPPVVASPLASFSPVFSVQTDCRLVLTEYAANPEWLAELRDPRFLSRSEIAARVLRYRQLSECLSTGDIPVTGELAQARDLADLFLSLAGPLIDEQYSGPGQGYLLQFANINDPAVVALREEARIPSPDGYIYIWLFPSRSAAPAVLQDVLANTSVRGVTLQTRYVVVMDDVERSTPLEEIQRRQRSATLSHEFVHAYIKSVLGPEQGFALPEWYDEGLAIYFSGSSEPTSVVFFDENGRQRYWSVPDEDYARYRDLFAFLEQEYGRAGLLSRIRRSVSENDPALLYRELGARDEAGLYSLAEAARIRRSLIRLGWVVGLPALIVMVLVAVNTIGPLAVLFSQLINGLRRSFDKTDVSWLRDRRNLPALVRLLKYHKRSDPVSAADTRYAAACALAELDDPRAVGPLQAALGDQSALVRAAAARSLGILARLDIHPDVPPVDPPTRTLVLAALFDQMRRDPLNEVRWAAAEAVYQTGGSQTLRPLLSEVRRWISQGSGSIRIANQRWFYQWAVQNNLDGLLIDLYPWFDPSLRRQVVWRLSTHLPTAVLERLAVARHSGDPDLRELAEAILNPPVRGDDETIL